MNLKNKILLPHSILTLALGFVFLLSLILFTVSNHKIRKIFIFPSVDEGKTVLEYRYFPISSESVQLRTFVDELLLGSQVERTKLLFTRGTKVNSCFIRKNVLYLDLSGELLEKTDGTVSMLNGVELLRKNIKKNFSNINQIELFVNGKYAFE